MELYGKKVILRALEEEDIEIFRELTNSPDFERMVVGWSLPISKREQKQWFENVLNDKSVLRFTIATKEDGTVGMIGLKDLDWKNGVASGLGMRIVRKEIRTKGLATDAWMTLMRYAFEELRLNRINGSSLSYNTISQHVCKKVGFKEEGCQRQAVFKNGQFHDLILFGCLKSDYESLVEMNHYWCE